MTHFSLLNKIDRAGDAHSEKGTGIVRCQRFHLNKGTPSATCCSRERGKPQFPVARGSNDIQIAVISHSTADIIGEGTWGVRHQLAHILKILPKACERG